MTDTDPTPNGGSEVEGQPHPAGEFSPLPVDRTASVALEIIDAIESVIVGQRPAVEHVVTTVLARGHILIEDVPGVGKTMLARSLARSIDCSFNRVQFTPDLLPSDITGVNVFNQQTREFEFRKGPIFANVVLGDEINRAPPKTQAALLEAMEEGQVTVEGTTYDVPTPFTVIATQNTVDADRTYDLPLAELDRFMKRISLGYPDREEEMEILDRVVDRHPIESVEPVADIDALLSARGTVSRVTTNDAIRSYVTDIVGYTRDRAELGVSPRGGIALLRASQARAILDGRDFVIPDDIQTEARGALAHRITPAGESAPAVIDAALDEVPVP